MSENTQQNGLHLETTSNRIHFFSCAFDLLNRDTFRSKNGMSNNPQSLQLACIRVNTHKIFSAGTTAEGSNKKGNSEKMQHFGSNLQISESEDNFRTFDSNPK